PLSGRQHAVELTGSMLLAAVVAALASVVLIVLGGMTPAPELIAWTVGASTLSSWSLLAVGRMWRGRKGDQTVRRAFLLVVGLAVAVAVWALAGALFVEFRYLSPNQVDALAHAPRELATWTSFYSHDGQPLLPAYLAFFGL